MLTELDVLGIVGDRLTANGVAFMLTGSFAMAHYTTPRMTRDIDIVVALSLDGVDRIVSALAGDFYVDADDARAAVRTERLFNLMHYASGVKVDLIVRKSSEYRALEFSRRTRVRIGAIETWIVSPEDLILSKLIWASDSASELQRRDVRQLLGGPVDVEYLRKWARVLGVESALEDVQR
jgi:nucleotidyltransferase AbiEii toxin of type IV toxin-antitoxin system